MVCTVAISALPLATSPAERPPTPSATIITSPKSSVRSGTPGNGPLLIRRSM